MPSERKIICHTLKSKNPTGQHGFVKPLAEIINGKLHKIEKNDFCGTQKVFITSNYDELEKSYPDHRIFQLEIRVSTKTSEIVSNEMACKYVASASDAAPIKTKDYFEIINHDLPPADHRNITPDELPGTSYIFINNGTNSYGPFRWKCTNQESTQLSIEIDFPNSPLPGVVLAPYQTYKFDSQKIKNLSIKSLTGDRQFLHGLSILQSTEYFDYASDEDIIRYCSKLATDQGLRIIEKAQVTALISHVLKSSKNNIELNKIRLRRMLEITDLTHSVRDEVAKSMSAFLNSDYGRPIVQNFIEQHENTLIEKLRKDKEEQINQDLSKIISDVTKAELRIKELHEKKNALNDEIQRLNADKERGVDLTQAYEQSDEALREKRIEYEEIESKIKHLAKEHNLVRQIDDLHADIRSLERQRKEAESRKEQAEEITRGIISTLTEKNSDLQRRMAELKPFVEAINGSFYSKSPTQENVSLETRALPDMSTSDGQKEVIKSVREALRSRGREIPEYKVANILITLQQSFLTIFAGLPGTGKTSLARLIADVQNVSPRLREVAVARGWTSQKDLIGYFNPLTNKFQPANTGMYSFLKALSVENNPDRAMAYILLDEANLSPIEHYWSSFMGITDDEQDRKIILGEETIKIPDNIRFIATINYDGTTEPLSPRLINRAPIIMLDAPSELQNIKAVWKAIDTNPPMPAQQMKELFGLSINIPDLDGNERSVYEKIKTCLLDPDPAYGRQIFISPRKENSIHQYCAKARILMNIDYDMMALDFAVQQHILPLIQGTGARFAKRLESLRSILINHDLPESAKILQRIITLGEADLQTYDFFCW